MTINNRLALIACAAALSLAVALSPSSAQDKKMGNETMAKDKMGKDKMGKDMPKDDMKKDKMKDDMGKKDDMKMKK